MTDNLQRLESLVEQMGEVVLATAETVERLAERVDALAVQVQHQGHQVQQQSYQIFAVSDALQTLVDKQAESQEQIQQLTAVLQGFVRALEK